MEDTMISVGDVIEAARKRAGTPAKNKEIFKPVPLAKAIFEGIESPTARDHVLAMVQKDLRSPDINALRLVSMADRVDELKNEETLFLSMLEMNPIFQARDLKISWREKRIGTDTADWVNLNVDDFPAVAVSKRPTRSNTVGFQGNRCSVRLITQALADQSPIEELNVMADEVDDELTRIRRAQETKLLSNTEVAMEGDVVAQQYGGMITRSTLYNASVSGDLTEAMIQARVDAIANATSTEGLGYNIPLVAMTDQSGQLAKVRNLMSVRYPGETSAAALGYQAKLQAMFSEAGMAVNQIKLYQPDPGSPVMFLYNPLMPANTCLFFDPRAAQLARFKIMGQNGPWALERPQQPLNTLVYVFDGVSLVDGLIERRAVLTGLGT